jgi:DNA-binding response OmpR family regulator
MSRAKNMGLPILVAESSSYYVSLIRDWLSDAGYGDIQFCATVEQARAMATEQKYGAIVMDARLQDGSGIMLAREIRHAPHSPNRMTPMVLLDCRSTRRRVSAARDGGIKHAVRSDRHVLRALVTAELDAAQRRQSRVAGVCACVAGRWVRSPRDWSDRYRPSGEVCKQR